MNTHRTPAHILTNDVVATSDVEAEVNNDQTLATLATRESLLARYDSVISDAAAKTVNASRQYEVHPFGVRFAENILTTRKRAGAMAPVAMWIDANATEANFRKGIGDPVSMRIDDALWKDAVYPALKIAAANLGITFGGASTQWRATYTAFANMKAPIDARGKFRLSIVK